MKRVLITGANGQLARQLVATAPDGFECIGRAHIELDICDSASIAQAMEKVRPNLVINGAAYNSVDKAESEGIADALRINAHGVALLAKACRDAQVPLVHFSTDYVFDGAKRGPYDERDRTAPLGVYGASKLAGENIALAAHPRNWAIRVCRLFGPDSAANFPCVMLKFARERGRVRVVNDQVGNPSYTPDVARAVWQLLRNSDGGLFQICNSGDVSFADYARAIFEAANVECEIESVSSEKYGAAARRPKYAAMSNAKAHGCGVVPLRSWRDALQEFLLNHSAK